MTMQPYYEQDGITIYHGDCREILPKLSQCAHLVLADPPYEQTSLEWDKTVSGWADIQKIRRVLLPEGSLWCFGSLGYFLRNKNEFVDYELVQEIVWEKHNGSNMHNDRFRRVHELVVQFRPFHVPWGSIYKNPVYTMDATRRTVQRRKDLPKHHLGSRGATEYISQDGGPRLQRSVQRVRSCHGYALHPTQKPVGILIPIIEYSCPFNGVVVDPFMGSGSTLEAARLLGRRAIGIELSEQNCEIAVKRLQQSVMVLT